MTTVQIELPPKLIPVFTGEADYRGAYGGRGSAKTRSFALMAAVRAHMWAQEGRTGVVVGGREFMNSLSDSSMAEIKAAIWSQPWLAPHFDIGEEYIRTIDRRVEFAFIGLRRNLDSIKSKARILLLWVDEAENVSETAWEKALPTVREEGSEVWVTWNPERKASATSFARLPQRVINQHLSEEVRFDRASAAPCALVTGRSQQGLKHLSGRDLQDGQWSSPPGLPQP